MKNRVTTDGITQNEVVLKRMLHAKFVYPCPHPNPSLLLRKQYLSLRERYVSQRDKHCSRSDKYCLRSKREGLG